MKATNVIAARERANLSRETLAKRIGTTVASIWRVENGKVELTPRWVDKLARAIGCSPNDLLPAASQVYPGLVEVRRYAAGEARVHPMEGVMPPLPVQVTVLSDNLVGVLVRTDDCWPRYDQGDVIFYRPNEDEPASFIGRECVVTTRAGSTFIRRLQAGSKDGLFRLISPRFPDIEEVRVSWAAPICWVKRAEPASAVQ